MFISLTTPVEITWMESCSIPQLSFKQLNSNRKLGSLFQSVLFIYSVDF